MSGCKTNRLTSDKRFLLRYRVAFPLTNRAVGLKIIYILLALDRLVYYIDPMNRNPEHDTREHLLATGETLCLALGFTGMGLSELLRKAEVPKGSFYHYFRSKEAFGVAMLERYYQRYNQHFSEQLHAPQGHHAERLLGWYQNALSEFLACGHLTHCLGLKLSAEVCDLSEDMRAALNSGSARVVAILTDSLEQVRQENKVNFDGETSVLAQIVYVLWLGAGLQAKLSRNPAPLENALAHIKSILVVPVS